MGGTYDAYVVNAESALIDAIGAACESYGLPKGIWYFPADMYIHYVFPGDLQENGEYADRGRAVSHRSVVKETTLLSSDFINGSVEIPMFHVITWSEASGFMMADMCGGDNGEPFFGIYPTEVYSSRILRATFDAFCEKYGFSIPLTGNVEPGEPNLKMLESIEEHYDLWYQVVIDYIESLKEA